MERDRQMMIARGAGPRAAQAGWLTLGGVLILSWQITGCGGPSGEPATGAVADQQSAETVGETNRDASAATSGTREGQPMPMGDANAHTTPPSAGGDSQRSDPIGPAQTGGGAGGVSPAGGGKGAAGAPVSDATLSLSPIAAEAVALARSTDAADHQRLVGLLLDTAWLDRLDAPELALVAGPESLQLGLVLDEAAVHAPSVLDRLIASPLYLRPGHRQIALIDASAEAKEPGAPLVKFWRSQLDPDADELESTILALVRNQTPPAIGVLEEAITTDVFDDELVFWWFRGPMLERRQAAPILSMADRLLRTDRLNGRRQAALVESLFDYRPRDWYIATEKPPRPPARAALDDRARALLRSIADSAVRSGLIDPPQRARIEAELTPAAP